MSENANGSAPEDAGILRGDRRRFLTGAALAAGATLAGSGRVRRARAADRAEITFASARFFGKSAVADLIEAYNSSQGKVHVTYVELPPPSQSTEVHQALVQQLARRSGTPDVFTQDVIWIAEFAGAGWALPLRLLHRRQGSGPVLPGRHQGLHLAGQADRAALVHRQRDALLPHRPARGGRRQGARDLGGAGRDRAEAPGIGGRQVRLPLAGQAGRGPGLRPGRDGRLERRLDPRARRQAGADRRRQGGRGRAVHARHHRQAEDQPGRRAELGRGALAPALHRRARRPSCATGPTSGPSPRTGPVSVVGKVGVAPLPHFAGGSSAACLGGYQLGVNAATKNRDAAVDFAAWMSSPSTQLTIAKAAGPGADASGPDGRPGAGEEPALRCTP